MTSGWTKLTVVLPVAAVAALALACGGGGGGGGGGIAPTLAVTEDNTEDVAGAVAGSTASLIVTAQEAPVDKAGSAAAGGAGIVGIVQDIVERLSKIDDAGPDVIARDLYEQTDYYGDGGFAVTWLTDRDDDRKLSTGDTVTVVFDECSELNSYIDGALSLQIDALARVKSTDYINCVATASAVNLVIGYVDEARELDGDFTLTMEIIPDTGTMTATIQGTELEMIEGTVEWTLRYYYLYYTSSTQTDSYRYMSSGGIDSEDDLGGAVTYSTVTPFEGTRYEYPSTGSMLIMGSDASRLTVDVDDHTWVTLDLDADGNGVNEYEVQLTWDELLAGAEEEVTEE